MTRWLVDFVLLLGQETNGCTLLYNHLKMLVFIL